MPIVSKEKGMRAVLIFLLLLKRAWIVFGKMDNGHGSIVFFLYEDKIFTTVVSMPFPFFGFFTTLLSFSGREGVGRGSFWYLWGWGHFGKSSIR